jgi:thiaminase (transcriptional activator TenA)
MLSDQLWQENHQLAENCLEHPFVQGLAKGSLEREAFTRYVAQDAFFLRAFLRAYAAAAAKCEDLEAAREFHAFMGGILEELQLHQGYAQRLNIDLFRVTPYPAARAYTDFLLASAWHRGVDEILAAMTPCMRLYAYLGAQLSGENHSEHPYKEWIETYSSDDFQNVAGRIENLLNRIAKDTPSVHDAYRYAMICEYEFFSAPLEAQS